MPEELWMRGKGFTGRKGGESGRGKKEHAGSEEAADGGEARGEGEKCTMQGCEIAQLRKLYTKSAGLLFVLMGLSTIIRNIDDTPKMFFAKNIPVHMHGQGTMVRCEKRERLVIKIYGEDM
ncbi:MAG: hypothetical protein IJB41_05860 [Clostridia bacterium]|nr:hypothetical protein [Clostridia bacterium]